MTVFEVAYWLFKSEPSSWSWREQLRDGVAEWDGVRNAQAASNMKAMGAGDLGFFYHSVVEKRIVGVVEVVRTYYPDPSDESGRFGMVDVKALRSLPHPVSLEAVKAEPRLGHLALVRQPRLSVSPIDAASWRILCRWGGVDEGAAGSAHDP